MKQAGKKHRFALTRRGFLALLGAMLGGSRWFVWSESASAKPALSMHEADFYRAHDERGANRWG